MFAASRNSERSLNRGFAYGLSVPSYITSTIDTRLVGKVQLNINYSNFNHADAGDAGQDALEVDAEEALAERRARQGDLEDQDAPARLQDPQAFTKRHAEVGHVA